MLLRAGRSGLFNQWDLLLQCTTLWHLYVLSCYGKGTTWQVF